MLKANKIRSLLLIILFAGAMIFTHPVTSKASTVVSYPVPSCYTTSPQYTVQADSTNIPVIDSSQVFEYYNYCNFSFSGTTTITITASEPINTYNISPLALGITATKSGNTLTFTLSESRYLIVKINSLKDLVIAADDLETDVPASSGTGIYNVKTQYGADSTGANMATSAIQNAIDAANVAGGGIVYVPAGVYKCGNLVLKSNVYVYLEGGSVIRGSGNPSDYTTKFHKDGLSSDGTWFIYTETNANNVKIYGRGTVDGNGDYMRNTNHYLNHVIVPIQCSNFKLDGIIVRDGGFWATIPTRSNNVTIQNTKHFQNNGRDHEDDAIDIQECQNVLVKHTIAISEDDTYSFKTWDVATTDIAANWPGSPESQSNVVVDDATAWSRAGAFKVGDGVKQPQDGIVVKNSYVFRCWRAAAVNYLHGGTETAKNVIFDNIDIEGYWPRAGWSARWTELNANAGPIKNVFYNNINIRDLGLASVMKGTSDTNKVSGVTFNNVRVKGKVATSLADLNITNTNSYAATPSFNTFKFEAEGYELGSGVSIETSTDGGLCIGSANNGDYIAFKDVNFGNTAKTYINMKVATANSGGTVEFHLDSPTGTTLGSWTVQSTGGWNTWSQKKVLLNPGLAVGTHTVYVTFVKSDSSTVANLTWFQFFSDVIKADASTNTVVIEQSNVASGDTVKVTAAGDRQSADGSAVGDEKYIPTTWSSTETGKYGNFIWNAAEEAYTSGYTASEGGTYTLTANFQKQTWNGSSWVSGTTDTKTVTLQVYTPTNTSGNSLSVSPSSVEVGQTVTITAEGNRQNITPTIVGDERYLPITWNSTEVGKSGVFTVSGQVYSSGYTTTTAGSYIISAIFQKQIWDGSSWVSGTTDIKTVTLQVYTPTNTSGNSLSVSPSSVEVGQTVTITAEGNRQNIMPTIVGDERYLPIAWNSTEAGKSGIFTVSGQVYQSSYTPSAAGVFTITVIYQKQVWDGTSWVNGAMDTNTATLTVSQVPTASSANNTLALDVSSIKAGGTVTITAEGDRQNEAGTVLGEEKYIPVTWSSTEDGKSGVFTVSGQVYSASYTTTAAGNYTITATFQKQSWNGTEWINGTTDTKTISLTVKAHSKGGSNGGGTSSETATGNTDVDILVNGKEESAGVATTTKDGDRTVTTVSIDQSKLEQKLSQEGNGAIVTIPVNNKADVVVGELTGQIVKSMETKEAVLQIKTENVTYTLPAAQINIDDVSKQIGAQVALADIKVKVTVATPSADTVNIVQDSAKKNSYQIVVKPVEFDITCTSGSKTVDVSKFNSYVERTIAIPDGIDSSKITTGVVLNADGTFSHVPTTITAIDGKYYAKINSLTNSTYSVIYSPKTFADIDTHWAKDAVNDMGSRLVIGGSGDGRFEPDRDITRAEFASIIVKGLGLMRPGTGKDIFTDVAKDSWYYDAVAIAYEYGIIDGYGNGSFGPEDKITREQAMTMTARAMKITGLKVEFKENEAEKLLSGFEDAGYSADYAKNSIASCIKTGIITGEDGNLVAPQNNITRAEVAVIVRRLLQKSGLI